MSAREFRVGELVDVTIRGARVEEITERMVHLSYGVGRATGIHFDAPGVTVDRVAPPEWPPRIGDLWSDASGELWFAHRVDNNQGVTETRLTSQGVSYSGPAYPATFLGSYGPVELVYRVPADPEADGDDL